MVVTGDTSPPIGTGLLSRTRMLLLEAAKRLYVRHETNRIDTVEGLALFSHTRAAFVAQKKLYGYLKARMGTRYPIMFKDEVFVQSVEMAKWHVFAACLSDIAVYTAARVMPEGNLTESEGGALARYCYEAGLACNAEGIPDVTLPPLWREAFAHRLAGTNWQRLAAGGAAMTESPRALYLWAPIEDSLKRLDREIVENSIRFAWGEIVRDFRKRAVPPEIAADFRQRESAEM